MLLAPDLEGHDGQHGLVGISAEPLPSPLEQTASGAADLGPVSHPVMAILPVVGIFVLLHSILPPWPACSRQRTPRPG